MYSFRLFSFLQHKLVFLPSLVIVLLLSSCKQLQYTPVETPQDFELRRHASVENYVKKELAGQQKTYSSVAFGESKIAKPSSYKQLDSLYEIKYNNEIHGKTNSSLEEQISLQKLRAVNDTNKVVYFENHIFSLETADTIEFYAALFQLENDLKVSNVTVNESVFLPIKFAELYKQYLFDESFLYPGNQANVSEQKFYKKYKAALQQFTGSERDAFILHTLTLMGFAEKQKVITPKELIKQLAIEKFADNKIQLDRNFSTITEESYLGESNQKIVTGYSFHYFFTEKENQQAIKYDYLLHYDNYLRLTNFTRN
jgi:hypothetical protein